jgi:hypothetical protein
MQEINTHLTYIQITIQEHKSHIFHSSILYKKKIKKMIHILCFFALSHILNQVVNFTFAAIPAS